MGNIVTETNLKAALSHFSMEREKSAALLNQVMNGKYNGKKDQVELICQTVESITRAEANMEYVQNILVNIAPNIEELIQKVSESTKKENNDNPT